MRLERFLEDLAEYAAADEVRDAAARMIGARPRSKTEALTVLGEVLQTSPSSMAPILEELYADTLRSWTRNVFGKPLNKGDAIAMLVRHYDTGGPPPFQWLIGLVSSLFGSSRPMRDSHVAPPADEDDVKDHDLSFEFDETHARTTLRPYQQAVVNALAAGAYPRANRKFLVHIATGGGKTRVVNDWLWQHVLPRRHRVLWVTKDWELLRQAASDICRRYPGGRQALGRVGGDGKFDELVDFARAPLVYTTIHTWNARRNGDFRGVDFEYVVIDEVHWGEGRPLYDALERRYSGATFIGLTATPRYWTDYSAIGGAYDFATLVHMNVLARPVIGDAQRTGITWSPTLNGRGDFSSTSLGQLARSQQRNRFIVDTYRRNASRFGKTLVFACDIAHADSLARQFQSAAFSAEALHSELPVDARRNVLSNFRTGPSESRSRTDILVNVAMLTHGVDIPDIETIFLCRPTASDILFSQMVGRGARRIDGRKDSFKIIDFVDNVSAHGQMLITAKQFFAGTFATPPPPEPPNSVRAQRRQKYPYAAARIIHYPGRPGFEALSGLEIQPRQSFGIEFEVTRDGFRPGERPKDWDVVAHQLIAAIRSVVGGDRVAREPSTGHGGDKNHEVWNVEWDGSCGWEVTTRILEGELGFEEAFSVARAIHDSAVRMNLRVDHRTGTHVHLAWAANNDGALQTLMAAVACWEPALFSLVAPARFENPYCRSVRAMWPMFGRFSHLSHWETHFRREVDGRYLTVNPQNLFGDLGTLEIRMHNGTTNGLKILAWVSLWMRLLEAVDRGASLPADVPGLSGLPLTPGREGDVVAILAELGAGSDLCDVTRRRRDEVLTGSWYPHREYGSLARMAHVTWRA